VPGGIRKRGQVAGKHELRADSLLAANQDRFTVQRLAGPARQARFDGDRRLDHVPQPVIAPAAAIVER
jgi:hypothetical protein